MLYLIFGLVIIAGLAFIFQPYWNWRKAKSQSGGLSNLKINYEGKEFDYKSFFSTYKNQKFQFSIVVPSYNEELRIGKMLGETIEYLQGKKYTFEIIVVNDASKDNTIREALKFQTHKGVKVDLKVVTYAVNRGKGGAVRVGMNLSQGDYALMVDADGATEIQDFQKVFDALKKIEKNGLGISAGSRNHLVSDVVIERKWYRNALMHISNFVIQNICGVKLKDTQCGFKIFTRNSYQLIFKTIHLERWAFDVEVFMIGNHYKMPVAEIPVNWHDVEGSKLNVIEASITMARDYILVRLLYLLGVWKYNDSFSK